MAKEVKHKCSWCGKKAITQTVKGKENEASGGLAINNGYFCGKCYEKGMQMEREAMYG